MSTRPALSFFAVLFLTVGMTLATPAHARAQGPCWQDDPPPPENCWVVVVIGGSAIRPTNTPQTAVFTISNEGIEDDAYALACASAGPVTCTGLSEQTVAVAAGLSREVTVFYNTGAPGSGTLTLTASSISSSSTAWAQGDYDVGVFTFSVAVTPDGGAEPTRVPNTGPYAAGFTVRNTGGISDSYSLGCSGSANVTCGTVGPNAVVLAAQAETTVTVSYTVGAAGAAMLNLTATAASGYSTDGGSRSFTVGQAAGAPIVDITPYQYAKQDYGRCAQACFATVYAQSTVPYISLGAPRSVALVYNSDRVNPRPFVHVDVTPDLSTGTPTEYQLQVKVNGAFITFVNGEALLHFAYPGNVKVRLAAQFDAAANGLDTTGVYPMEIVVTALLAGGPVGTTIPTKLVLVNEATSTVAAGWTLGGVQRLYPQSDGSALVTEGEGSAVYFWNVGGTLVSPAGEFSQLITGSPGGGSGWTRRTPDSTKVVFDDQGRMTEVRDRFGNATTLTYDPVQIRRVTQIRDPLNLALTLGYGANGLATIQDAGTLPRTTTVTVDAGRKLTQIVDPDTVRTRFTTDAAFLLTKVFNRRGDSTVFTYSTLGSRKLIGITAPPIAIHGEPSPVSPATTLSPWQQVGVPYAVTAGSPAVAPLADTVRARVVDPRGYATSFTVNPWGTPRQTTDALAGVTTVTYDANGLPVRAALPTGGVDTVGYTGNGLPSYIRSPGDSATRIYYGPFAQPSDILVSGRPAMHNVIGLNGRIDATIVSDFAQTNFTYDSRGRLVTATDPEGHLLVRHTYAGTNENVSQDSLPGGRVTTYLHDAYGRDTAVTSAGQLTQRTHYDVLNRPTHVYAGPNAAPTVQAYDSLFLRSVTDPKGQVYAFGYNAVGWLVQRVDPQNHADQYAYDRNGNLKRWINRRLDSLIYTYDALNRPTGKTGSNTAAETWAYSADHRMLTSTSPVATETIYLGVAMRPDSIKTVMTGQTYWRRYWYTPAGLRDSVEAAGGGITFRARKYVYDATLGTLTEIRLAGAATVKQANRDGRDTSITFPGGDRVRLADYALHGVAQISSTVGYNSTIMRSVSYDSLGRISAQVTGSTGHRYTYDARGRLRTDSLIEDVLPGGTCGDPPTEVDENGDMCLESSGWQVTGGVEFAYDSVGNRLDKGGSYLTGNRVTQFDGCSYTTDLDGNVTLRACGADTVRFYWSAESRLDSLRAGAERIGFRYDAGGRLVRRDLGGAAATFLLWDGADLLAELNAAGTASVAEYSYYPGLDRPHAVIVGGQQYNAHVDAIGNVIALTDGAQAVQRTYAYDPWGQLTGGSDTRPFANADRARFKGALWWGPEADLYYMRARWYEPKTGRFLSEDPIGLAGGVNPHAFVGSDPINRRDPTGLEPCEWLSMFNEWWCPAVEVLADGPWPFSTPREMGWNANPSSRGATPGGGIGLPISPANGGGGSAVRSLGKRGPSCREAKYLLAAQVASDVLFFATGGLEGIALAAKGGWWAIKGLLTRAPWYARQSLLSSAARIAPIAGRTIGAAYVGSRGVGVGAAAAIDAVGGWTSGFNAKDAMLGLIPIVGSANAYLNMKAACAQ